MEEIAAIRRMYYIRKMGYKTIARELGMSKNTVKKIIRKDIIKQSYSRSKQGYPVLGKYVLLLKSKLRFDKDEPLRRRRTAKKLYEELHTTGYLGSYESVNNYVKKWKRDNSQKASKTVYVPLGFDKGEAFQFDWSTEEIKLAGELTRIKVAQIRLSYSRLFLVMAFPNEQLEMVMESHNKAFEFFEGVCKKGIYDNMKTAVQKVLVGKERIFNKRFSEMASHYLFEPIACTPAAGWEKGQIENQVSTVRKNFFTPLCCVSSLDELNEKLKQQCLEWAKTRKHPEVKEKTVWEMYLNEKAYLTSYKKQFEPFKVISGTVSSYSLITFDSNQYSVDCNYIHEPVQTRVYSNKIIIMYKEKVIGTHKRCFLKNKRIYDPWHYVTALLRKPGALRNGAPFKSLELPKAVIEMQQLLKKHTHGEKEFIKLLLKAKELGLDTLEKACIEALNCGVSNCDWIVNKMDKKDLNNKIAFESNNFLNIQETPNNDCSLYNLMLTKVMTSLVKGGSYAS